MSGPHNIDNFSKATYMLPCHYDPYHNKIAKWLEDSYILIKERLSKEAFILKLVVKKKKKTISNSSNSFLC
jgi:hypothetical protein